ncbi:hypothetical protein PN466_18645 [Roseofilum reptotaenium CS-1145]|uniref:Uncharacterized protein n=1 Tax=Roseofilum reptotaenium AO1-A TaxID=1925591 RepID=A0A1L9QTH7_9CYAN|nr:hypothetical protein [Roseofilum reptotaenium]MDB9518967.1 hypothetical protein [Roseofilum reptotaenium CS-1145]OJJ25974.1 hypothetical protein BI308_08415 [Roseofilum reptotaenium AO1-A]
MSSTADNPNPPKKKVNLPEPDQDNITVLTNKLPKRPILPWNRYDSPWHDPEKKGSLKEEESKIAPNVEYEEAETPEETQKGNTIPFKRHQG